MVQRSVNQYFNLKFIPINQSSNSKHRSLHWNTNTLVPQPASLASGSLHLSLCLLGGLELVLSDGKYGSGHWFSIRWQCHLSTLCAPMWVSYLPMKYLKRIASLITGIREANWENIGRDWHSVCQGWNFGPAWSSSWRWERRCQAGDWKYLLMAHFLCVLCN